MQAFPSTRFSLGAGDQLQHSQGRGLDLHPVSKGTIHSNGQEEECKLYPKSRSNKLGRLATVIPAP